MPLARSMLIALALWLPVCAEAGPIDFVTQVRPIFEQHCYRCHSLGKQKSGLRLDTKAAAMKGGEAFGAAIVPGKPDESPLLRLVRGDEEGLRMPPQDPALTPPEIAVLQQWIQQGAVWPEGVDRVADVDPREHWSFQPLATPELPAVADVSWARQPIDRFVLAGLEAAGLTPSSAAEPVAWLRRVCFDLTGLPPTPELAERFLSDPSDAAYGYVVDELLGSPRYGERWAQHWLDVVRYADTHGFEVNTERPHAWPYRDYVICALNRDTPYVQFLREQLMGDQLGEDAATGFLVTASVLLPGQIGKDEPSKRLARYDALDEILTNVGQTFLGLSVGCARCHDHKFDPVAQREYYSLLAFFGGVEYGDRNLRTPEAEAQRVRQREANERLNTVQERLTHLVPLARTGALRAAVNARLNVDRFLPQRAKRLRFVIQATNNREPCLDELEVFDTAGANVAAAKAGAKVTSSGDLPGSERHRLSHLNDGKYGNARSWISSESGKGWVEIEFARECLIERVLWGRDREGKLTDRLAIEYQIDVGDDKGNWQTVADAADRQPFDAGRKGVAAQPTAGLAANEQAEAARLQSEQKRLEAQIKSLDAGQKAFAGVFRAPDTIQLLSRGDPEQPQGEVTPAVPAILGNLSLAAGTTETSRRAALAEWLASPTNPLTARVYVNRIWQGHFGTGLVETSSDFGLGGTRPSHPELLDWLAGALIRGGWSSKGLHRQIVLSATYRQSAQIAASAAEQDAEVRLLWRYPAGRLSGEAIRDSMLATSGRLQATMYGPGFDLFDRRGGLTGFAPVETYAGEGLRRMIYAHKVRRERDAVFGAFDCPDGGQSTSRRRESTTPIQALNLLNSRFAIDAAKGFAERVQAEAGAATSDRVLRAYVLAYTREPTPEELREACAVVERHGLATLCRALFNSNEFLFVP